MHYLLFIPDCKPSDIEATAKIAGLASIIGEADVAPGHTGPDGQTGVMCGWLSENARLMHYADDQQTWVPSFAKDEHGKPLYWVGFWNDKPPTESELRRHYTQAGPRIKLGEQSWKLPTPDSVDARAVYSDDGSMRWEVIRQFSWVCDEADALKEVYLEDFGVREIVFQHEPSEQIGWLTKLLQINYRLIPEVAAHLDIWIGKQHLIDVFIMTLGLSRKDAD